MGKSSKGRGLLVFKGDEAPSKKKKKAKKKSSKSKHSLDTRDEQHHTSSPASSNQDLKVASSSTAAASSSALQQRQQQQQQTPQIQTGNGKITTSGNVIMGLNTNFDTQMRAGDAILATPPPPSSSSSSSQEEMRILTMILSSTSASLSTPFSSDLRTPTSYKYINKPRNAQAEERLKKEHKQYEKEEEEKMAFGTYGSSSKSEVVYREKTEHGSYRIRKEKMEDGRIMDRGDLLNIRTKKKSDKYC